MQPTRGDAPASGTAEAHDASARARDPSGPILVVDDDDLVVAFVARVLRLHGLDVRTARDARETFRLLDGEATPPAVLVVDADVPGTAGRDLVGQLEAERPGLAVVAMTGDPAAAAQRRRGGGRVLLKPFDVDEVIEAVAGVAGPRPGPDAPPVP